MALDVTVVIPVYNEAECIGAVIESWPERRALPAV